MNKYIKILSVVLVLSSSVFLPDANAVSTGKTTEMLITLAETDPMLIDRLNDFALNDAELLQQLLKMAGADPVRLENLVDIAESDVDMFWKLANIYNVKSSSTIEPAEEEQQMSTFGAIDDGSVIRN